MLSVRSACIAQRPPRLTFQSKTSFLYRAAALSVSCSARNDSNPQIIQNQRKCGCSELLIPGNLDIDREAPLNGTMAAYNRHLLISTGKSDWSSKIEFEGGLAAEVKGALGRAGLNKGYDDLRDPNNIILTTNSSYKPSSISLAQNGASAYIFPQNLYLPAIPLSSALHNGASPTVELIRTYLLPTSPLPSKLIQALDLPLPPRKVHETHILICTHKSRDSRCGIIGPILHMLFTNYLSSRNLLHPKDPDASVRGKVRVGNISHVGGHKYAGNVIVYLPPDDDNWDRGGKGIWYGRVGGERDVERIVDQTVLRGNIIEELFRGRVGH
ncbi:Sucrase/ferredoxin-like-domain-containing protein [Kalaharituber pfeilii]|nr:Sucrase/ferredoxin-like-domain-containing protein [Kalaharituber pfeilii]